MSDENNKKLWGNYENPISLSCHVDVNCRSSGSIYIRECHGEDGEIPHEILLSRYEQRDLYELLKERFE